MNENERQKCRRYIADSLVKEEWIPESMELYEKQKMAAKDTEEYYNNEMTLLTNDKRLSNHKRHQRLIHLIEKVQNVSNDRIDKPLKLNGLIQGTDLIWAKAKFESSHV